MLRSFNIKLTVVDGREMQAAKELNEISRPITLSCITLRNGNFASVNLTRSALCDMKMTISPFTIV
jgi:hypothetical protein